MASQLLQLMRAYGVAPNEVTFTCILSEMSKAKQVRDGDDVLNVLLCRPVDMHRGTLRVCLGGLLSAADPRAARSRGC